MWKRLHSDLCGLALGFPLHPLTTWLCSQSPEVYVCASTVNCLVSAHLILFPRISKCLHKKQSIFEDCEIQRNPLCFLYAFEHDCKVVRLCLVYEIRNVSYSLKIVYYHCFFIVYTAGRCCGRLIWCCLDFLSRMPTFTIWVSLHPSSANDFQKIHVLVVFVL